MEIKVYGMRFNNEDNEALDITINPEGEGFILRLPGGAEWWIDDIHDFAQKVLTLAKRT